MPSQCMRVGEKRKEKSVMKFPGRLPWTTLLAATRRSSVSQKVDGVGVRGPATRPEKARIEFAFSRCDGSDSSGDGVQSNMHKVEELHDPMKRGMDVINKVAVEELEPIQVGGVGDLVDHQTAKEKPNLAAIVVLIFRRG